MSLESPVTGLQEWVAKQKEQAAVQQEVQTEIPESTEVADTQVAEAQPTEQPEPTIATIEEKVETVESWDATEPEATTVATPQFDFKSLGSALDLGEVKSE